MCSFEFNLKKIDTYKSGVFRRDFSCSNCAARLTNSIKGERIRIVALSFLVIGIVTFGDKWPVAEPVPTLLILVGIALLIFSAKLVTYTALYKKT